MKLNIAVAAAIGAGRVYGTDATLYRFWHNGDWGYAIHDTDGPGRIMEGQVAVAMFSDNGSRVAFTEDSSSDEQHKVRILLKRNRANPECVCFGKADARDKHADWCPAAQVTSGWVTP